MAEKISEFQRNNAADRASVEKTAVIDENVAIQPVASGQNAQAAFAGTSAAFDHLGALGASVASNAAQQRAAQQALMDAQHPTGEALLPEFSSSGKAYVDMYNQQSLNVLTHQGQMDLDNAYTELSKNPTSTSLLQYQKQGQDTIKNLTKLGTDANRFNVQRDLENAYQNGFSRLSAHVNAKIKKEQADNYNMAHDQGLQDQINLGSIGKFKELDQKTADLLQNNKIAFESGAIGADVRASRAKTIAINDVTAKQMYGLAIAEKTGTADEYLKRFIDTPHPGLETLDVQTVATSLYKTLQLQRTIKSGQENLDYTQAKIELTNGVNPTATKLDEWKSKLSPQDFMNIQLTIAQSNVKQLKDLNTLRDIQASLGDPMKLADFGNEDINSYFDTVVAQAEYNMGQPLSIIQKAAIASQIDAPITNFTKGLVTTARSGKDLANVSQSLAGAYSLVQSGSVSAQGIPEDVQAMAIRYDAISQEKDITPDEAAQLARNEILLPKTDKAYEEIQGRYDTFFRNNKLNDSTKAIEYAAKQIGFDGADVPVGFSKTYNERLNHNFFVANGDEDTAIEMTNKQINQQFSVTKINGRKQLMYAAPEKYVPYGDIADKWMRADVRLELEPIFDAQKKAYDAGLVGFYYEFGAKKNAIQRKLGDESNFGVIGDLLSSKKSENEFKGKDQKKEDVFQNNGPLVVRKIYRPNPNTKRQRADEGIIEINSDNRTTLLKNGSVPSYMLQFVQDGLPSALGSPTNAQAAARYTPNIERVKKKYELTDEQFQKEIEIIKQMELNSISAGILYAP